MGFRQNDGVHPGGGGCAMGNGLSDVFRKLIVSYYEATYVVVARDLHDPVPIQ